MSEKTEAEEIFGIKKQVDSVTLEVALLIRKRAKEFFPQNQRSAYLFNARVINLLFGSTFIRMFDLAEEEIKKQESLNDN